MLLPTGTVARRVAKVPAERSRLTFRPIAWTRAKALDHAQINLRDYIYPATNKFERLHSRANKFARLHLAQCLDCFVKKIRLICEHIIDQGELRMLSLLHEFEHAALVRQHVELAHPG